MDLSGNCLSSIDGVTGLVHLEALDVSRYSTHRLARPLHVWLLTAVCPFVCVWLCPPPLAISGLPRNKLTECSQLLSLTALTSLDLSSNSLGPEQLIPLHRTVLALRSLSELSATENGVSSLPGYKMLVLQNERCVT